ncbi:MAG: ribosome biogenesis GTP-binding protein YihA/YsxC [Gammaproteobacteria bacterium]|jgi:GTP-binding protein
MENPFRQASFMLSAARAAQFPDDRGREVAFAGRSNAGKSSALNAITGRNGLARTSKTPGRTQLINFFALGETARLVDLPGYGFAKVPEPVRESWRRLMDSYLTDRQSLAGMVLIMDIRHPMREFDQLMLDYCADIGCPVHVLLTKADKLSRNQARQAEMQVTRALGGTATVQTFSALKKAGVDQARTQLATWLDLGI